MVQYITTFSPPKMVVSPVMGVPPVIILFGWGFSSTNQASLGDTTTIVGIHHKHFLGYPHVCNFPPWKPHETSPEPPYKNHLHQGQFTQPRPLRWRVRPSDRRWASSWGPTWWVIRPRPTADWRRCEGWCGWRRPRDGTLSGAKAWGENRWNLLKCRSCGCSFLHISKCDKTLR